MRQRYERGLQKMNGWDLVPAISSLSGKRRAGGDVFETETLLGPLSDSSPGDDIGSINRDMRSRGMAQKFVVFHTGAYTCAADNEVGDYAELSQADFRVIRRFSSLDEWYVETLRKEYGAKYGLRPVSPEHRDAVRGGSLGGETDGTV